MYKRLFLTTLLGLMLFFTGTSYAGPSENIDGYAWSSNIGWISFNCENSNCTSTNYGVDLGDPTDGYRYFSGYAWSSNIGWISFNADDVSGCPGGGSCAPRINVATGLGEGWGKAIAGENDTTDDWDGWVKLGGNTTIGTPYGLQLVGEDFEGWSWAGENDAEGSPDGIIGWISWNCSDRGVCADSNYRVAFKHATITVTKSGNGTVLSGDAGQQINCGTDCEGEYLVDSSVTLTAYPDDGYFFDGWTNCSPADTAECQVVASFDKEVHVTFAPVDFYTGVRFVDDITGGQIVPGDGGSVTEIAHGVDCFDEECGYGVQTGDQVDLMAIPDPGYVFVQWFDPSDNLPCASALANPCSFIKASGLQAAKAQFRKTQCNNTRDDEQPVGDGFIDDADPQCSSIDDDNETENEIPFSDNCPADGPGECPVCNDGVDNEVAPDGLIDYAGFCSGAPDQRNEADCDASQTEEVTTTWYPTDPGCRGSRFRTTESAIDNRVKEY